MYPRIFLNALIFSNAHALFNVDRVQLAGQALENAADVGSGMISAAADAAAASAGMSAHLAGRAAAEAGAIAAAASGVSAASTLAGDVLGGQLALGADVLSQLVPKPFQHFHNLANLAAVGLGSGTAGFLAGNAMGGVLPYPSLAGLFTFPTLKLASTTFMSELFGLKPLSMTPFTFYQTVRTVVDTYFDPTTGTFLAANPTEFIARLNEALTIEQTTGDRGILPTVQQDLLNISRRFPIIGTPLFLIYLHEIIGLILETLVGGRPMFPPDWHFPGLPNYDHHHHHHSPYFDSHHHLPHLDPHHYLLGGIGRLSAYPDPLGLFGRPVTGAEVPSGSLRNNSSPASMRLFDSKPSYTIAHSTVAQPEALEPNAESTYTTGATPTSLGTAGAAEAQEVNPDMANAMTSGGSGTQLTLPEGAEAAIDLAEGPSVELAAILGFEAAEVSPVCGVVSLPQIGTYPLLASIVGELSINLPGSGQVAVESFPDGRTNVLIPGVGPVVSQVSSIVAVADIATFGPAPLYVSSEGTLNIDLGDQGSAPISSTLVHGLSALVPGVGNLQVTLRKPARLLTFVAGIGAAPLNIATTGRLTTSLYGIGTFGVTASVTGTLSALIPGIGVTRLIGVPSLRSPAPLDSVIVSRIGTFPVHTQPDGAVVVPIPGLGSFPVTATPVGQLQISTPMGAYDVTTSGQNIPLALGQQNPFQGGVPPSSTATITTPPRPSKQTPITRTTATLSRTGVAGDLTVQADWQPTENWAWGLSDAAVYLLQKLDIFRPAMMAPEVFLNLVNQTILQLKTMQLTWPAVTPLLFVRGLTNGLGNAVDLAPMTIESIGEYVARSLEGPFPPFSQILDHISEVITQKLEYI